MKINIVEDKEKKSSKKIIPIAIFVFLIVISIVGYLFINKTPSDYTVYKEKEKIYKENNIEYTYSNYKQDEKIIKQDSIKTDKNINSPSFVKNKGLSEPTKQLINKNDKILSDLKDESMINTTTDEIIKSITLQSKSMNDFILSHCGYPDSKFNDDYKASKDYIDSLVASMVPNAKQPEILFGQESIDAQSEIKYCIMEKSQYHANSGFTKYERCLLNWMKIGHPTINNIETISLEKSNDKTIFDNIYGNNLNAIIVSNNIKYKIFLSSQITDGKKPEYKVLDVQRL